MEVITQYPAYTYGGDREHETRRLIADSELNLTPGQIRLSVLVILMCGEPQSDILAQKRRVWNKRPWFDPT